MCYWSARCDSTGERDASPGLPDVRNGQRGLDVPVECAGCGALLYRDWRPSGLAPTSGRDGRG